MDSTNSSTESARIIDLTKEAEVLFWCRVLDVTMAQLRDAVHHAGHQVEEVRRYLEKKKGAAA